MLEIEKLAVKYFYDEHGQLLSCLQFLDLLNLQVICHKCHYTDLSREWTQWFIKNGTYTNQNVNLFMIGCEMTSYHFKLSEHKKKILATNHMDSCDKYSVYPLLDE